MIKRTSTPIAILFIVLSSSAQDHYWRPQSSRDAAFERFYLSHRVGLGGYGATSLDSNTWAANSYDSVVIFAIVKKGNSIMISSKQTGDYYYIADSMGVARMYVVWGDEGKKLGEFRPEYHWYGPVSRELVTDHPVLFYQGYTEMPGTAFKPPHVKKHWDRGTKIIQGVIVGFLFLVLSVGFNGKQ